MRGMGRCAATWVRRSGVLVKNMPSFDQALVYTPGTLLHTAQRWREALRRCLQQHSPPFHYC